MKKRKLKKLLRQAHANHDAAARAVLDQEIEIANLQRREEQLVAELNVTEQLYVSTSQILTDLQAAIESAPTLKEFLVAWTPPAGRQT